MFKSTADTENRLKDKERVESQLGLKEQGDSTTKFYSPYGTLLAVGYTRIVYGDHGAYCECKPEFIKVKYLKCFRKNIGYYNKYYPIDGSNVLFYEQIKSVKDLPNPLKGKYSVCHNRKEGYADYIVGMWYVSPFDIKLRNGFGLADYLKKHKVEI